jgi:photosystem II stability/assembly factor-like uncharacterized protein
MEERSMDQDYVYCLACSPDYKKSSLVFAAKKGGLFRSTDGGRHWNDAYASLKLKAALPTTFVTVTIVDEITYVYASAEGKILRSLDAGETWKAAELGRPAPVVTSLAVSPNFAVDGTLLAATIQDGIFCSNDRGITWTSWNFGLFDPNVNTLTCAQNASHSLKFLAGTQSCIFSSANAGRTWNELDFPLELTPVLCLAVGGDGVIYAGTESEGLYCSRDEGTTWKRLTKGSMEQIVVDVKNNILIIQDGKMRLSEDKGKTWQARKGCKAEPSCIAAPLGLGSAKPLFVGSSTGEIIKL